MKTLKTKFNTVYKIQDNNRINASHHFVILRIAVRYHEGRTLS